MFEPVGPVVAEVIADIETANEPKKSVMRNDVLGGIWHDAKEKPFPLKPGDKSDKFVVETLYNTTEMMYYYYDDEKWFSHGNVKRWYRVPPFNSVESTTRDEGLSEVITDIEIASEPIQNALYSTGRFTTEQCDELADGILQYIKDAGFFIGKKK